MNKDKVSVIVTVFNEKKSIVKLLDSLSKQSLKPSEILIIDAGSTDKTVELINKHKLKIKLFIKEGISRSAARNLGVKLAQNEILAMTDAGCIAKKDWVKNLVKPITNKESEVVAGFYNMIGKNNLQKCMAIFLGVLPKDFNNKFLPSTRSIAFTKRVWKKVKGFPEDLKDTAEDTIFNYKLINKGVKIKLAKNARVEWGMPDNIFLFFKKLHRYAKGDAQSKIIWNSQKGLMSHNIKVLFVFSRYIVFILLIVLTFYNWSLLPYLLILTFLYIIYSFFKVFKKVGKREIALYGPLLQIISDLAVMSGFISGII